MIEYTRFEFCPRCGLAELKEFSNKAMRCTECGYVYFHNTAAAAGAIIETGEGVLVTIRGEEPMAGMYDLPGGFVDYDESLEDAVIREVREELGISITIDRYIGSYSNSYTYRRVTYFTCDTFFVCRPQQDDVKVVLSREIKDWRIIPSDRLLTVEYAFKSHLQALTRYVTER